MIEIRPVTQFPAGFETLHAAARAEGYSNLDWLAADWATGTTRFDRSGEKLLAAYVDGVLAGIGGITLDPVEEGALRMRRFYVAAAHRRHGAGRALAAALLAGASAERRPVMVNATPGSVPFWESLGFVPNARNGHTHALAATAPPRR